MAKYEGRLYYRLDITKWTLIALYPYQDDSNYDWKHKTRGVLAGRLCMGISDKMEVADWPLLMNKKLASGSAISQNNSSDMQEAISLKRDDFMEPLKLLNY